VSGPAPTVCPAANVSITFDAEGKKTATFSNLTQRPIDVFTTAVSGPDGTDFKISNDQCIAQSLAVGGHCTMDITFSAVNGSGTKSGQVALEDAQGKQVLVIALLGTSTKAGVVKSPGGGINLSSLALPVILVAAAVAVILYYLRIRRRRELLKIKLEDRD
jgi:hypothetical protein